MDNQPKLALGTVQFGMPYGIANTRGQISIREGYKIIEIAKQSGVDTLDTAIGYGDSEKVLGQIGVKDFRIISKLPSQPPHCVDIDSWMRKEIENSLNRLNVTKLYGLLLHRSADLSEKNKEVVYSTLQDLKRSGMVSKIGISIYSYMELENLDDFIFDIVQTPFNLIDREIFLSGWLDKLHQRNTEIHARSVFLQGLLLQDSKKRDQKFSKWDSIWRIWDSYSENVMAKKLNICLDFVKSHTQISRIVIGVDSVRHFQDIISSFVNKKYSSLDSLKNMQSSDLALINPSLWNKF
jgi:aryl-alcohol dehydrogenase-like predicted oxidoreductase